MNQRTDKTMRLLGILKVWQTRLSTYVAMIQFVMVFYLYIIEAPMGLTWYHWVILMTSAVILIVYIDTKFILPTSADYTFEKTPHFMKMKKDLEYVKDVLEKQSMDNNKIFK